LLFRVSTSAFVAALLFSPAVQADTAGSGWSSRSSGGFGVAGQRAQASGVFANRSHRGYGYDDSYGRRGISVPGGYFGGYGGGRVVNNVTMIVGSNRDDEDTRRVVPHFVPVPIHAPSLTTAQDEAYGPVLYRIHKGPRASTRESRTRAAGRVDLGSGAWSGARIVDVHVR